LNLFLKFFSGIYTVFVGEERTAMTVKGGIFMKFEKDLPESIRNRQESLIS